MRALKVLIVIMGILLVLGFTILAVTVFRKFQGLGSLHTTSVQAEEIVLPKGYRVMEIADISDRAVIHLRSPTDEDAILIVNPHSGQEVVRIGLPRSGE